MTSPVEIRADDALLQQLPFKKYRYTKTRKAQQFLPEEDQPQTEKVKTPWGAELEAQKGDYLVSDQENPTDQWVVEKEIFEDSYRSASLRDQEEADLYTKSALVELVPLTKVTRDPDREVTVYSREVL